MKRLSYALVSLRMLTILLVAACATVQPGEIAAVTADFALVQADVVALAADNAPEYAALKAKIDAKDYFGASLAALALADKLKASGGPLVQHVHDLRVDLRKLFTVNEAEAESTLAPRIAR